MKTLGLVGGTSWVSTLDYYRLINEGVNRRLGGNQFAECLIHSFNYADIQKLTFAGDWKGVEKKVADAASGLRDAGALLACTEIPWPWSSRTPTCRVFDTTAIHAQAAVEFALS
jgi:aspartate/glutamate racemase